MSNKFSNDKGGIIISYITCERCQKEYYLHHIKYPFTDRGDVLYCECHNELFRYGKGTDDYQLIDVEEHRKNLQKQDEEMAMRPVCRCGNKMVPRTGPYGKFYGCSNYPHGCNEIVEM